jgi:hypothetical protein
MFEEISEKKISDHEQHQPQNPQPTNAQVKDLIASITKSFI